MIILILILKSYSLFIRVVPVTSWPVIRYPADYLCRISSIQPDNQILWWSVRMFVCPSKRPYVFRMYVRQSLYLWIFTNLLCYSTKNLRNYAFICLFKGIFVVKYKRLNGSISGRIIWKSRIWSNIKNSWISGPTL